jgi:Fe2+ transport system protein B
MPSTVATVMGLVAKEEVVSVLGVLYGADDAADVVDDEDMTEEEKAEALSPIATAFNESSNGHGRLAVCLHDFQPPVRSLLRGHRRDEA